MHFKTMAPLGAACLGVVLFAGCASKPPASEAPAPTPVVQAPAPAPAPAPAAPPAPKLPEDGTVAEFEGQATALPASAQELLDLIAKDGAGKRWEIKGYSDRKSVKNAREVALARGLAVRKALVERGIPAQQMRLMYSTDTEREAVTVLPR